ncbi:MULTISPECIES: AraC family transcriptional regulator [Flavobacteriaceae]|uniref:AraC family transcriptional regulator n=1 Tax=Flavobacteriaceae TaxID=49546 RepID=UPI0014920EFC|nr:MULTISPECIES: AraC family transcriptional regulator [Allomuricauda]MDC6366907.1 AraC family transcriptional regulator [Muricauda sp. AC10]
MKLHLLNRSSDAESSFTIAYNSYPNFLKVWHYHKELELVFIEKSTGTRFIGDSIQKFKPGEIILLGKNLPHMWQNDDMYFESEVPNSAEAIAIHFTEDFLGKEFFASAEFAHIGQMLKLAQQGIKFENLEESIYQSMRNILHLDSFAKTIAFLELLNKLSHCKTYNLLSSMGYMDDFGQNKTNRLRKVYAYTFDNFKNDIGSNTVAQQIGMNTSAFCRFFRKTHRKPYTRYLNEVRVGYACKLLLENQNNITGAAYESGFKSISNFNRQFKIIKNMSPKDYIKFHKNSQYIN